MNHAPSGISMNIQFFVGPMILTDAHFSFWILCPFLLWPMNPQYQEQEVWTVLQTCKQSHLLFFLNGKGGACYHNLVLSNLVTWKAWYKSSSKLRMNTLKIRSETDLADFPTVFSNYAWWCSIFCELDVARLACRSSSSVLLKSYLSVDIWGSIGALLALVPLFGWELG
jgi:hypothetical protein